MPVPMITTEVLDEFRKDCEIRKSRGFTLQILQMMISGNKFLYGSLYHTSSKFGSEESLAMASFVYEIIRRQYKSNHAKDPRHSACPPTVTPKTIIDFTDAAKNHAVSIAVGVDGLRQICVDEVRKIDPLVADFIFKLSSETKSPEITSDLCSTMYLMICFRAEKDDERKFGRR